MGRSRRDEPSRHVANYLAGNEHVVLEMTQHWARVLPAVLCCFTGLLLTLVANVTASGYVEPLATVAWWIWFVLVVHLAWRIAEWWDEKFVITNKRLLLVHGIFVKKVAMMPLSKVTDMSYNRSVGARLLGYGTFVMESAGQEQALSTIDYVRHPDARYRLLCSLIFDDEGETPAAEPAERYRNHVEDEAAWDEDVDGGASSWAAPDDRTPAQPWPARPAARGPAHDGETVALPVHRRSPSRLDDTDPYGMVTEPRQPADWRRTDPYAVPRDDGESSPDHDPESAWSVSREHATAPQPVRRARNADNPATWRDDA